MRLRAHAITVEYIDDGDDDDDHKNKYKLN